MPVPPATTITGTSGDDELYGTVGNDVIDGLEGNDLIVGNLGSDWVTYAGSPGAVEIFISASSGSASGGYGDDILTDIENAAGSAFDDVLVGTSAPAGGANIFNGLSGNDLLVGGRGDDTLYGGDGDDTLYGQQGDDIIDGEGGNDFMRGGSGNDTLTGGSGFDRVSFFPTGNDTVTSGVTVSLLLQGAAQDTGQGLDTLSGIEALSGTPYNDSLTGDGNANWLVSADFDGAGGDDQLSGLGGSDLFEVAAGNHVLDGGADSDTLSFNALGFALPSGVNVSLALQGAAQTTGIGSMTISNVESLSGTSLADTLTGDGNANALYGAGGNDVLNGGGGSDTIYGDALVSAYNPSESGNGASGPTLYTDVTLFGQAAGDDVLDGGAGDDILNGGAGNDTASFASSTGRVIASLNPVGNGFASNEDGTEVDSLFSIENLAGSAFNDSLNGNNSANILTGGDGHDLLFGRGGDDVMIGGEGDDFLRGSDGADTLDGGNGWDRVSSFVPTPVAGISFDLNIQGVAQDTGQGFDTLIGIEHASGTTLNDTLTGNAGDNWLWDGGDGDETTAASGNDVINAGAGNDLVELGNGNDTVDGGTGTDTLSFLGGQTEITTAGVTFSLALQGAAQATEQGSLNASGFENVSGSIHDDVLTGTASANILLGDWGSDTLSGGDGDDSLYGDGRLHVDTHLTGGSGPITLFGDAEAAFPGGLGVDGNDVLNGGKGDDSLYGGRGDDVLTGDQGSDRFVIEALSGDDRIADFKNADTIVFDASSGVDAFSDLTLIRVGRDTLISWGTGDSLLVEGVRPNQLDASDFDFAGAAAARVAVSADGGQDRGWYVPDHGIGLG